MCINTQYILINHCGVSYDNSDEPWEKLSIELERNAVSDEIVLRTQSNDCCMGLLVLWVGGWVWFVSVVCAVGGLGRVCVYMGCFPQGLSRNKEIVTGRKRNINGRFTVGKQTDRVDFTKKAKVVTRKWVRFLKTDGGKGFCHIQDG